MKNFRFPELSGLPEKKRRALKTITKTIVNAKGLTVEMVLLYGSYARGDFVEDISVEHGAVFEYVSDYDLIALVEDHREANRSNVRLKLDEELRNNNPTAPNVSVEIMSVDQFNKNLRAGHYFFKDVKEEGVVLYDSGRRALDAPAKLSPQERQQRSREYFEDWYGQGLAFFSGYRFYRESGDRRRAAFMLHQTVEGLLSAFLLAVTAYRPKVHDVRKLLQLAASGYPELIRIFPSITKADKDRFEALKSYYIDARYTLGFTADSADLDILSAQAETLRAVVFEKCMERIETELPGHLPLDWYTPPDFENAAAPEVELGEKILRLEKELHAKQLDLEASRKREEESLKRESLERAEKEKERKEKEESLKRESLERAEKEESLKRENQERAEKEESLLREVEAKKREEKERAEKEESLKREFQERAEKERERKEKEESLKRENQERAEKERLAELLKKAGIDPDKKLK